MKVTLEQINSLEHTEFVSVLGNIFEHSPWIAEATWKQRPFDSIDTLHKALVKTVQDATEEEQLDLIQAHPDLAGKLAISGQLTEESVDEQKSAQLDKLNEVQFARMTKLNNAYREKFHFPFIICVKDHTQASIFENFEKRVEHSRSDEINMALYQIGRIAWHRLQDVVTQ